MKKYTCCLSVIIALACNNNNNTQAANPTTDSSKNFIKDNNDTIISAAATQNDVLDFIPAGYKLFEKITGDINGDNQADCILMVKNTDTANFVKDEYRGLLDRNRRGLIVLLNKGGQYQLLVKNLQCFSSENEDGGVYYAPELSLGIVKGKLQVDYAHGRYGYWNYTLRISGNDMQLIGYDASSHTGPVVNRVTSINFLTKKKLIKENTNEEAESGEEVFKESWHTINLPAPIMLSTIKDFDDLGMWDY